MRKLHAEPGQAVLHRHQVAWINVAESAPSGLDRDKEEDAATWVGRAGHKGQPDPGRPAPHGILQEHRHGGLHLTADRKPVELAGHSMARPSAQTCRRCGPRRTGSEQPLLAPPAISPCPWMKSSILLDDRAKEPSSPPTLSRRALVSISAGPSEGGVADGTMSFSVGSAAEGVTTMGPF